MTAQVTSVWDSDGVLLRPGDKVQIVKAAGGAGKILLNRTGTCGGGSIANGILYCAVYAEELGILWIRGDQLRIVAKPDISLSFEDIFNNAGGGI